MKAYRLEGLTGESPELAVLWDLGCLGLLEEGDADGVAVVAYFDSERELPLPGTWLTLPDVDHVALYRAGLEPVRFRDLVVAPTHSRVELSSPDTVLWLDPGSAFGTGHHETTGMALAALGGLDLDGRTVLDLGSGSGLLAIAADRFGAAAAYGVDLDAGTVTVARGNAVLNRSRARFAVGSLDTPGLPGRFDVIVANLYAELHAELFPRYLRRLTEGGRLLLTGILGARRGLVEAAAPAAARLVGEDRSGDWLLLQYLLAPQAGRAR